MLPFSSKDNLERKNIIELDLASSEDFATWDETGIFKMRFCQGEKVCELIKRA